MNPYLLQIARLEEKLEAMRQRAEAAESALRGNDWDKVVPPCSLYETRVLRILAKRDATGEEIVRGLTANYEGTNTNSFKSILTRMRQKLPAAIVPPRSAPQGWGCSSTYTIPDRDALKAFLATGEMPQVRRAA